MRHHHALEEIPPIPKASLKHLSQNTPAAKSSVKSLPDAAPSNVCETNWFSYFRAISHHSRKVARMP